MPSSIEADRPPNGSLRARRAAFVVALVRAYGDIELDQIRDTLGWSPAEMNQVLADITTISRELDLFAEVS